MFLQDNRIITQDNLPTDIDLKEGAMLLIDKPIGWTSFDVVNKIRFAIRHHLQVKKFKVGHSGTLDPMATGLLLICVGKYTKLLHGLTAASKAYTGKIRLGATTPSYDAESDIDQEYSTEGITDQKLLDAMRSFVGGYAQVPPLYSAIKVDGQKLYKLARRGESIELEPRPVMIDSFDLRVRQGDDIDFYCACGKGTYIRSLAYDLGRKLDSGAYLAGLRRVSIESYHVDKALSVEEAVAWVRT